jgi:hypothetical protein
MHRREVHLRLLTGPVVSPARGGRARLAADDQIRSSIAECERPVRQVDGRCGLTAGNSGRDHGRDRAAGALRRQVRRCPPRVRGRAGRRGDSGGARGTGLCGHVAGRRGRADRVLRGCLPSVSRAGRPARRRPGRLLAGVQLWIPSRPAGRCRRLERARQVSRRDPSMSGSPMGSQRWPSRARIPRRSAGSGARRRRSRVDSGGRTSRRWGSRWRGGRW